MLFADTGDPVHARYYESTGQIRVQAIGGVLPRSRGVAYYTLADDNPYLPTDNTRIKIPADSNPARFTCIYPTNNCHDWSGPSHRFYHTLSKDTYDSPQIRHSPAVAGPLRNSAIYRVHFAISRRRWAIRSRDPGKR